MVPEIRAGLNTYFFLRHGQPEAELPEKKPDGVDVLLPPGTAWRRLLPQIARHQSAHQALRRLLNGTHRHESWRRTEHGLLDSLAVVLSTGLLRVVHRYEPSGGGGSPVEEGIPSPAAQPYVAPRRAEAAAAPTPEEPETFGPDVHQDIQAAALIAAAKSGVPFCDECAKAATR